MSHPHRVYLVSIAISFVARCYECNPRSLAVRRTGVGADA